MDQHQTMEEFAKSHLLSAWHWLTRYSLTRLCLCVGHCVPRRWSLGAFTALYLLLRRWSLGAFTALYLLLRRWSLGAFTALYLLVGFVLFVFAPAIVFSWLEDWNYREAVYYAFITLSTVGFGDYTAGEILS